jgi:hypothetical protein
MSRQLPGNVNINRSNASPHRSPLVPRGPVIPMSEDRRINQPDLFSSETTLEPSDNSTESDDAEV